MPGEGPAGEIGGDGEAGLVEEVLMTSGDQRLDLGGEMEAEAMGLGDGVNVGLWAERGIGKAACFGGR